MQQLLLVLFPALPKYIQAIRCNVRARRCEMYQEGEPHHACGTDKHPHIRLCAAAVATMQHMNHMMTQQAQAVRLLASSSADVKKLACRQVFQAHEDLTRCKA